MKVRIQLNATQPMQTIRGKLENVQHLRGFAAIIVIFEHTLHRSEWYGQTAPFLRSLQGWGLSGVDVFFVISGFVMVYSQLHAPKTAVDFLTGRLIRIVPLYWILTLSLALTVATVPNIFRTLNFDGFYVFVSLLFVSQATLAQAPFIDVGWTLEWEMLFYVLFATTVAAKTPERQFAIMSGLLLTVAIALDRLFVLEFALGMIAAHMMVQCNLRAYGPLIFVIGALALISDMYLELPVDRLLVWGMPAFLMVLGAATSAQIANKFCSYLGAASYSIYLVQVASIPVFYKFSSQFLPDVQGDLLAVTCVAWSVITGCVLYSSLEKPIILALRNFTRLVRSEFARI